MAVSSWNCSKEMPEIQWRYCSACFPHSHGLPWPQERLGFEGHGLKISPRQKHLIWETGKSGCLPLLPSPWKLKDKTDFQTNAFYSGQNLFTALQKKTCTCIHTEDPRVTVSGRMKPRLLASEYIQVTCTCWSTFLFLSFFFFLVALTSFFFFYLWWILSYIEMKQPWVYTCSPSRSPLPPPSPPNPSRSSQCTRSERLSHASNLGWWSVSP